MNNSTTASEDFTSFYLTRSGIIAPTIAGTISCVSSFIIILIIARSQRNTPYHRIMFAYSLNDIFLSFAIALTTLPMPKDVIYQFQWPSYGTTGTCTAQGLVYGFGVVFSVGMSCILNIYYFSTLCFEMNEKTFGRKVEPCLYILATFIACSLGAYVPWKNDLINPSPMESFCSLAFYPWGCDAAENTECIRGDTTGGAFVFVSNAFLIYVCSAFGLVIFTMIAVIVLVVKRKSSARRRQHIRRLERLSTPANTYASSVISIDHEFQNKLVTTVALQALMYIVAFILTWAFIFILILTLEDSSGKTLYLFRSNIPVELLLRQLQVIFQPLQGFFNMIIFIYHKVSLIKNHTNCDSTWGSVLVLFQKPLDVPYIVISSIELIEEHRVMNILSLTRSDNGIIESSPGAASIISGSMHASGFPSLAGERKNDDEDEVERQDSLHSLEREHDSQDSLRQNRRKTYYTSLRGNGDT